MERVPDHAFFSAWRFDLGRHPLVGQNPVHLLQDHARVTGTTKPVLVT